MFRTATLSFIGAAVMAVLTTSSVLADNKPAAAARANPLLTKSPLPFQAPPFDKIQDADYQPAIEEGIRQQKAEVEQVANNTAAPTFDNTIAAMEKTGQTLNRVLLVFSGVAGANTDDTLQKVQEDTASELQAAQDAITLNPKLFARIETLYNQRASLKLDPESDRLLWFYYTEAVLAGAKLSDKDKETLKKLNGEEAELSAKFTNQLLAAAKDGALVTSDPKDLAGLSQGELDAAAQAAKARKLDGKWLIPIINTTQQPRLQELSNRATREKLFDASWTRAEKGDANDTRATILRIAAIRAEKAKLLGYPDYATWRLQDQMAKTPAAVDKMLSDLASGIAVKQKEEAADIQALIDQQKGGFKLKPWDWNLYSEQVRKAKYDLDDSEIKPYFELNKVLQDGVFYAANQLYGLTFKERKDIPVYNPDVRVFEVFDNDGKHLGLFYCDYFKRDNKQGGAWMSNFVTQSTVLGQTPVIYNVANFTKPAPGQPALLSFDDVTTMFHEFGHGLHGLFASQKYPTLSGANTSRDWVEFPSQFNEHWASDPKVFAHYAVHYKTGAPMPQALVDKIKKAATFNKGYSAGEVLAASELDMKWHELAAGATPTDVDAFEAQALASTGLDVEHVPTRYRSSYFLHIWSNGYSAGYYAYTWTKMLADDAFSWFDENGGLTRANGDRFRKLILSRGNTEDYNTMFTAFRGRPANSQAMLKGLGLKQK